jgi:hypothetical protein
LQTPADDGSPRIDLAVPAFGYKNHIGSRIAPHIAACICLRDQGGELGPVVTGRVRHRPGADQAVTTIGAYRSRANERLLAQNGRRSKIHRNKPPRMKRTIWLTGRLARHPEAACASISAAS